VAADASARERFIRRLVPSTVLLSRNRLFMGALDLLDAPVTRIVPRFRGLPPNHMRVRIGVGNRLLFNQPVFLHHGERVVRFLTDNGFADNRSDIVDLGCGCGRLAIALDRAGFTGGYVGLDIEAEMIAWCQAHLADERFSFGHIDRHNSLYNPAGKPGLRAVPVADAHADVVTSHSLFTHLLVDELVHYVRESVRILRPGGHMAMTVFCLDDMRRQGRLGGRWTFAHRIGEASVESLKYPEAAVAYEAAYLIGVARDAGFASAELRPGGPQSWLIAKR